MALELCMVMLHRLKGIESSQNVIMDISIVLVMKLNLSKSFT